jgi:uncharacterized membrane protein
MNAHSDPNPPTDVPPDRSTSSRLIPGGRSVIAGNGIAWIASGWALFIKAPGIWIANVFIIIGLSIVISLFPLLGGLVSNVLMPIFAGGIMLGCRSLEHGGELRVDHVFAGFKEKGGQLALVGVLTLVATTIALILTVIVAVVILGAALLQGMGNEQALRDLISERGLLTLAILGLLFLALIIPVSMAYWFAPSLIVFHDLDALGAMKQSFQGCLRNLVPFLLYGVVLLVLLIIGSLPLFLGLLVVAPLTIGSIYASYKDIYLAE